MPDQIQHGPLTGLSHALTGSRLHWEAFLNLIVAESDEATELRGHYRFYCEEAGITDPIFTIEHARQNRRVWESAHSANCFGSRDMPDDHPRRTLTRAVARAVTSASPVPTDGSIALVAMQGGNPATFWDDAYGAGGSSSRQPSAACLDASPHSFANVNIPMVNPFRFADYPAFTVWNYLNGQYRMVGDGRVWFPPTRAEFAPEHIASETLAAAHRVQHFNPIPLDPWDFVPMCASNLTEMAYAAGWFPGDPEVLRSLRRRLGSLDVPLLRDRAEGHPSLRPLRHPECNIGTFLRTLIEWHRLLGNPDGAVFPAPPEYSFLPGMTRDVSQGEPRPLEGYYGLSPSRPEPPRVRFTSSRPPLRKHRTVAALPLP